MVAREGFVYEQKPLSVTRNVVVWEGWSLVRVVVCQGFYCTCFLDASKAFDRVNHFKLFTTLSKRNVPMYIIRILIFWYTSQTMYVLWNNTISTGFNVSNGVRQGGILSPYLFCIYVDELSKMLNNVHVGCFVGTMLVNHLIYADDLVLLSPSAAGLSVLLSICSTYGIEYDVMYNSTQSNVLVFRSKLLKNVQVPEFEINNTAIDRVSMYKYLGHCINDKLSDDDDMTRQRNKIYAQGNALIRKFYMCTENVKIALFKSYCTTLYTSTLWYKYRRESLRKLCVAYNNIFRKLTHQARDCSASQMFVSRQLPTCKMLIRRNAFIVPTTPLTLSRPDPDLASLSMQPPGVFFRWCICTMVPSGV